MWQKSFLFVAVTLVLPVIIRPEPWLPQEKTAKTLTVRPKLEFHVDEVKRVVEHQLRDVSFNIKWENYTELGNRNSLPQKYILKVYSEDTNILGVYNSSYPLCVSPDEEGQNITFTVIGVFLGFTKVRVEVQPAPLGCDNQDFFLGNATNFELPVSVIRYPSVLVDIVTGVMAALVAFNFVNMGVQLDMPSICKVLKKPVGPIIGFVCQFFFMPLAAFGIGWLLFDNVSLRLGLFTLGCSPGGSMSNFWTLLFHGDVNLSVTMTFISTIAALAMMPMWIFTLGRSLFRDREAAIPYINLAGSLVLLTIPIGVGLLIQQYSPRLTKLSHKIIKPVTLLCVVFGVVVGLYANNFVFKLFTWQVVMAGIGVAWGGYSFGALTAWVFRLDRAQIIAVSIETAFQNPAVAFVLLLMSLPQPEADLTSVPVIAQLMLTGLPMWALLVITTIYKKLKNVRLPSKAVEADELDKDYVAVSTSPPGDGGRGEESLVPGNNLKKVQIVRVKPSP